MTPVKRGRRAEEFVKSSLWRRDLRVRDVASLKLGFDLFVENKFRVEVKSIYKSSSTTVSLNLEKFDVLAVVILEDKTVKAYYLKDKEALKTLSVIGSPDVYEITSLAVNTLFTNKAREVFS